MAATFYSQALAMFDWQAIANDIDTCIEEVRGHVSRGYPEATVETGHASASFDPFDAVVEGTAYLGTTFFIMPSGKYWTFWACSNTTADERDRDTRFMEALERAADKYGLYIRSGEGDPCDMYAAKGEDFDV